MNENSEVKFNLEEPEKPAKKKEAEITEKDIRELESSELQTNILPPEAFEQNLKDAEIQDIASNGNYTFVVRKIGDVPKVQIYSEVGLMSLPEGIPFSNFTYGDLLEMTKKSNGGYWAWSKTDSDNIHKYLRRANLFISEEEMNKVVDIMRKKFSSGSGGSEFQSISNIESKIKTENLASEAVLPVKTLRTKVSSHGEKFMLTYGEEALIYVVRQGDKNLLPTDWIRKNYNSKDDFRNKAKKEASDPGMDEYFVFEDKSRVITEAGVVATFSEKEILTFVDKDTRTNYFRAGSRDFDLDPTDKKTVFFVKSEGTNTFGVVDASQTKSKKWKISEREASSINGKILEMKFDPNGNFINVIYETTAESGKPAQRKLAILEKDTLEKVKEYDGVNGCLEVDPTGTIYYEDTNHQLRAITTNFNTFPEGGLEAIKQKRLEQLKNLQERIGTLDIEKIKVRGGKDLKPTEIKEDVLKEQLRKKIADIFGKELKKAKNLEAIGELEDKIDALKSDPDFVQYPDAFFDIENQVREQANVIKTASLGNLLDQVTENAGTVADFEGALGLEKDLNELLKIRQSVNISNPEKRRTIDASIKTIEKKTGDLMKEYQDELMKKVGEEFDVVSEIIKNAASAEELKDATLTPEINHFEERLGQIRDRAKQKNWRDKYKSLINQQRSAIQEKQKVQKEEERFQIATQIEDANTTLEDIRRTLDSDFENVTDYERWLKTSPPILTKYRAQILALPDQIRREREEELKFILESQRQELLKEKRVVIPKKGEMVKFGKEDFPIFKQEEIFWKPDIEDGKLVFRDTQGRVYETPMEMAPEELNDRELIDIYSETAKDFFEQFKREVPGFDENWVLSDFYKSKLEQMAKLAKIQMEHQRGVLILEGEAGTGKNVLFDMFGHFTNREVYVFSCNLQTEKEDLTYAFRFDPKQGTYQVESKVLEALQTPGAILVFDEINTLPKGVAKMLNPLLDYRRALFFSEDRKKSIKAHPSVLIAGTENPQHYLGVNPLSQEVKSRARIMKVGYPPEKVRDGGREKFAADESMIYAKYVDSLMSLRQEEFQKLWDYIINNEKDNGGDKFHTKEREEDIKKLRTLVGTANLIRSAYDAFRTGKSNDIFEFVFSLREGVDIATEMANTPNVKEAIKEVVLPKISDAAEAERVEKIIDNY